MELTSANISKLFGKKQMFNRPYTLILKVKQTVKQEKFPLQTFAPIRIFLFQGSKIFFIKLNQV